MKVTIRIYGKTDPDIMGVCLIPKFDFQSVFHHVLCSYVRGDPYKVDYSFKYYNVTAFPTVMQRHIILDPSDDADVIRWLKRIRPMERNKFIKNLFRNSLAVYPAYNYFRCEKDFEDFLKEVQVNADSAGNSNKEVLLKDPKEVHNSEPQEMENPSIPEEVKGATPPFSTNKANVLSSSFTEKTDKKEEIGARLSEQAQDPNANEPDAALESNIGSDLEMDDIDDFDDLEQMMGQFKR